MSDMETKVAAHFAGYRHRWQGTGGRTHIEPCDREAARYLLAAQQPMSLTEDEAVEIFATALYFSLKKSYPKAVTEIGRRKVDDRLAAIIFNGEIHVANIRAAYLALALRALPGQAWQPIESAPDGEVHIWVFGGAVSKPEVREADGGWWRTEKASGNRSIPTHWQPLYIPTPPTKEPV